MTATSFSLYSTRRKAVIAGMLDILILLGFMVAGALVAGLKQAPKQASVERLLVVALWLLLFSMGFRIGNDPQILSSIGRIGLLGLVSALATITGSCVLVLAAELVLHGKLGTNAKASGEQHTQRTVVTHSLWERVKAPVRLLAIVALGLVIGALLPRLGFDPGIITTWTLYFLLFLIGMQFRQSGIALGKALANPSILILPVATAVGSMLGGILLMPLFSLTPGKALAVASGFGWYSLSGVLIANMGDPALGTAAFVANMLRESLGLLLIPLLGKSRVPQLAISAAGATAMDVSLPLIEQTLGPAAIPESFFSGAVLSLLVPVLVPFFMRL
ncbi:MAG: lysine exporter LysO family protein [Spirochaetaceae bacterium]|nr:lysine exporter LysO family protein [Spirochaetaceae bacterium]